MAQSYSDAVGFTRKFAEMHARSEGGFLIEELRL